MITKEEKLEAIQNYERGGFYLSKIFWAKYGKIGLQTYGQTHIKGGNNESKNR